MSDGKMQKKPKMEDSSRSLTEKHNSSAKIKIAHHGHRVAQVMVQAYKP
jgi:hypothetical protein